MQGWMKHKLESRLPGENTNNLKYTDDTTLMAESEEDLKSRLMNVKESSYFALFSWCWLVMYLQGLEHGSAETAAARIAVDRWKADLQ